MAKVCFVLEINSFGIESSSSLFSRGEQNSISFIKIPLGPEERGRGARLPRFLGGGAQHTLIAFRENIYVILSNRFACPCVCALNGLCISRVTRRSEETSPSDVSP